MREVNVHSSSGVLEFFRTLGGALVFLMALTISLYGVLTLDSAHVHFTTAGNPEMLGKLTALRDASDTGKWPQAVEKVAESTGGFITLLGIASSPKHAFGTDSLMEHSLVYARSSKLNGATLSSHILFGSVCLIFGALQFWPAFRQRNPKWHRRMGVAYFVCVQLSMIASMVYLLRTPVDNILDQLFFTTGLWFLAISVTVTLWMSIYCLAKKRYAQHQGWMWLNFGLLLSTPLLRMGWLAFGAWFPDRRWMETNYAVSDLVIPFSIMSAYAMFTLSRRQQLKRAASTLAMEKRSRTPNPEIGRILALGLMTVLLLSAWLMIKHHALNIGIVSIDGATELIPVGVRRAHEVMLVNSGLSRAIFVVAVLTGLVSGGWFLWSSFVSRTRVGSGTITGAWGMSISAGVMSCVLVLWGVDLGAPSYATLSGGTLYVFGGGVTLMLSFALARSLWRKELAWTKEWGLFTLTCLLAPGSVFLTLPALGLIGFESHFVEAGHLYRIAQAGQWMTLIVPFIYAINGPATRERIAR